MAKFYAKKQSKRIKASKRYKIEKKVREHNRKVRKEAKKNPKNKPKIMQVPNQCPFKEELLQEVEAMKRQNEAEKEKRREEARERKRALQTGNLSTLVSNAAQKESIFNPHVPIPSTVVSTQEKEENSLKAYYKEFKKVLDAADVILEVVDARDPLGTRCKQVEEAVKSAPGNKKLVLLLNKADLVPRDNLDAWLKYLRASLPTVAFKASTQHQGKRLGHRKLGLKKEDMIQSSTCFGAELLLQLLGNYCRSHDGVKKSIRVGIVGLPNVGKSSIINSLKRSKACSVGSTPGVTRAMQVVQLDSKVKLLDSPGIVFSSSHQENADESSIALKNAVKIETLKDPYTPATAILRRVAKDQIMQLYDMEDFATPDEFFAKKATRMGLFKKGGIVDSLAAARCVLQDWNSGKIRYYTVPPETPDAQISATIVSQVGEAFDIEKFAAEEKMMLDAVAEVTGKVNPIVVDPLVIESSGPVAAAAVVEDEERKFKLQQRKKKMLEANKAKNEARKKKADPLFEIEGNQRINKLNKLQFKKEKKDRVRRERDASARVDELEGFGLQNAGESDAYNFDTDFNMS